MKGQVSHSGTTSKMSRLPHHIVLLILICIAWMTVGCSEGPPKDAVVLWTAFEGVELDTLRARVADFEKQSGRQVALLKVPFAGLRKKILVAGPALQGPDVLIGPHDWIGLLQTADLLAPIPEDVLEADAGGFYPICLKAVTYDNAHYSAPMMMECVVLARNTDLCPDRPQNLDELVTIAEKCQDLPNGVRGFAYELDDFYFTWAFMAGFGTDFLAPFYKKDFQIDQLQFDTPNSVKGAEWVSNLRLKYKLVPAGIENEMAVELFLKHKLGMMLCGPWNLGAIRKAGVPYALEPIPDGPEGPSSPFVGVTGAMLSRYSVDKPGVKELLIFLSSAETGAILCESSGRAPVRQGAADLLAERVTDPSVTRDLKLFSSAAQNGTPLPNHPAMAPVWDIMKQAFELITTGQTGAEEELSRTTERVRAKIRFMME
jgi:arabinogalactan oligomer / maltooligosaccharide transport system substrate-binding protein